MQIISAPRDDDLIALIHDIHQQAIPGHAKRGYALLTGEPTKEVAVRYFLFKINVPIVVPCLVIDVFFTVCHR